MSGPVAFHGYIAYAYNLTRREIVGYYLEMVEVREGAYVDLMGLGESRQILTELLLMFRWGIGKSHLWRSDW